MVVKIAENKVGVFGFAETNFNLNPITTKICLNRAKGVLFRETGKRVNLSIQTSSYTGRMGAGISQGGGGVHSSSGELGVQGRWQGGGSREAQKMEHHNRANKRNRDILHNHIQGV